MVLEVKGSRLNVGWKKAAVIGSPSIPINNDDAEKKLRRQSNVAELRRSMMDSPFSSPIKGPKTTVNAPYDS